MAQILSSNASVEHTHALPSLTDSIKELGRLIRDPSDLDSAELPKLDNLIDDWYRDDYHVSEEEFARRMLEVFQNSTHSEVFDKVVDKLSPVQQTTLTAFLAQEITAEDAGKVLVEHAEAAAKVEPPSEAVEAMAMDVEATAASPQKFIRGQETDLVFENWGRTVKNTPAVTYYPENVSEVQTIVQEAINNNRGVRVSGFRHSWAPVFGRNNKPGQANNGDVLISTLTNWNATVLPNFTSLPGSLFQPKATELNNISVVDAAYVNGPPLAKGRKYVRVGTSTTNEQFRRWCIDEGNVTLPMNIIEVEITMGGSNATICHGAGVKHPTLSDLVRCIEYVDANAQVRTLNMSDPDLMKAASGCFGLLGVVTHLVLECDEMITAVMRPTKLDVIDAVPPPPGMKWTDIPLPLRQIRTQNQKQIAQRNFERRANEDFYAEWFWFPYSSQIWINTWGVDKSTKNVVNYPSYAKTFIQVLGSAIMNMGQNIMEKIDALQSHPYMQTAFLSWLSMKNLDTRDEHQDPIRTLLPNALHFQRGVQNIRVRDLEIELPLHAKKGTTTERDYTNVQRAWWDAIIECYKAKDTCPQRMPLEMRIMGSSEVTMAPQRGHKLGTCAIEILTLRAVSDIWEPYAQKVLDKWMTYTDNEGKPLVIRPHWAKEWDAYKVNDRPWRETLKNVTYKKEIAEFQTLMAAIGKKHGWTLADIKKTFSNEVLDYLYLDDVVGKEKKSEVRIHNTNVVEKKTGPIVTTAEIII